MDGLSPHAPRTDVANTVHHGAAWLLRLSTGERGPACRGAKEMSEASARNFWRGERIQLRALMGATTMNCISALPPKSSPQAIRCRCSHRHLREQCGIGHPIFSAQCSQLLRANRALPTPRQRFHRSALDSAPMARCTVVARLRILEREEDAVQN